MACRTTANQKAVSTRSQLPTYRKHSGSNVMWVFWQFISCMCNWETDDKAQTEKMAEATSGAQQRPAQRPAQPLTSLRKKHLSLPRCPAPNSPQRETALQLLFLLTSRQPGVPPRRRQNPQTPTQYRQPEPPPAPPRAGRVRAVLRRCRWRRSSERRFPPPEGGEEGTAPGCAAAPTSVSAGTAGGFSRQFILINLLNNKNTSVKKIMFIFIQFVLTFIQKSSIKKKKEIKKEML